MPCGGSASSTGSETEAIEPSVEPWRYRNKLEYSFGEHDDPVSSLGSTPAEAGRTCVDVTDCHLASEA